MHYQLAQRARLSKGTVGGLLFWSNILSPSSELKCVGWEIRWYRETGKGSDLFQAIFLFTIPAGPDNVLYLHPFWQIWVTIHPCNLVTQPNWFLLKHFSPEDGGSKVPTVYICLFLCGSLQIPTDLTSYLFYTWTSHMRDKVAFQVKVMSEATTTQITLETRFHSTLIASVSLKSTLARVKFVAVWASVEISMFSSSADWSFTLNSIPGSSTCIPLQHLNETWNEKWHY